MLEIFKNNFFLLFYSIALVLSLVKFPKYFDSVLKYFPILIAYTLCTELLGMVVFNYEDVSLVIKKGFSHYTVIIYNLYDLLFFSFFFYVFYKLISKPKIKQIIKYGAGLYLIVMLVNALAYSPMLDDMWYAYTFGASLLIFATSYYLYSLRIHSWQIVVSDLLFWVSLGCLLFHIAYAPIMILQNNETVWMRENYNLTRAVHLMAITLMYLCFIIGFLTMRRMPAMKK